MSRITLKWAIAGVRAIDCTWHRCRPATAEPLLPSTCSVRRSSRRTRVAHELDQRRGRILDRDAIALAPLVDALGRGDPRGRRHPHDAADDGLDDVAPVRVHIEDDAAAAGAIIPTRPLAGLLAAVEHPPAELEAESHHAPELPAARERGELLQSRQMDLVLDDAVLDAAPPRL